MRVSHTDKKMIEWHKSLEAESVRYSVNENKFDGNDSANRRSRENQ